MMYKYVLMRKAVGREISVVIRHDSKKKIVTVICDDNEIRDKTISLINGDRDFRIAIGTDIKNLDRYGYERGKAIDSDLFMYILACEIWQHIDNLFLINIKEVEGEL